MTMACLCVSIGSIGVPMLFAPKCQHATISRRTSLTGLPSTASSRILSTPLSSRVPVFQRGGGDVSRIWLTPAADGVTASTLTVVACFSRLAYARCAHRLPRVCPARTRPCLADAQPGPERRESPWGVSREACLQLLELRLACGAESPTVPSLRADRRESPCIPCPGRALPSLRQAL